MNAGANAFKAYNGHSQKPDFWEETRFLYQRAIAPRNRVSAIAFASHRNIDEETRFLYPTRSRLARKSTNRNLCDRQPTIPTDKDDLFANFPTPDRSAIAFT